MNFSKGYYGPGLKSYSSLCRILLGESFFISFVLRKVMQTSRAITAKQRCHIPQKDSEDSAMSDIRHLSSNVQKLAMHKLLLCHCKFFPMGVGTPIGGLIRLRSHLLCQLMLSWTLNRNLTIINYVSCSAQKCNMFSNRTASRC